MPRYASDTLTPRESQIMSILWDLEEATSQDIRKALADGLHDSTIRTFLRVLIEKRQVRVDRRTRPAVYRPAVAQSKVQRQAARGLVQRLFYGSAESLVLRLLEDEQLTVAQLAELRRAYLRNQKRGDSP